MMYRNYIRGQHESLDVDLTDAGSGAIFVKADGLEANAFYDMAIYSDSGRTTPLSVSDWENYTEDTRKTASEAETGGTGETIYNQIRIINPTYQTGTIYLSFENLGTYPNGDVQGIDYIEPGDDDYAYTTQIGKMTYIVFDGLTADRTVTVTDGGFDERSRFKIVNKDSTYKVIVKDVTENISHWVIAGQTAEFYDLSNSLTWSSAGDEYVYITPTPLTGPNVIASTALSTGFIVQKGTYDVNCYGGGLVATGVVNVDKNYASVYAAVLPAASNAYLYYLLSSDSFTYNQGPIETIKLRHDAA